MKYLITLHGGQTKEVLILEEPVIECYAKFDGKAEFLTRKELIKNLAFYDSDLLTNPAYHLKLMHGRYLQGESELFEFYKLDLNPITKLEIIQ